MARRAMGVAAVLMVVLGGMRSSGAEPAGCVGYQTFASTSGLTLSGAAAAAGSALRLTPAAASQIGGAWAPASLADGRTLDTTFRFKISGVGGAADGAGNAGGDGFAFVVQAGSSPTTGLGGGTLGYQGIPNSLAVEFDTWWNPSMGDPDGNHVGVHTRGADGNGAWEGAARARTSDVPNLSDGAEHTVRITYDPPAVVEGGKLSVFVDDLSAAKLENAIDLGVVLNLAAGPVWVGFTASTGAAYENHDIVSWSSCTRIPVSLSAHPYVLNVQGSAPSAKAPALNASLSTIAAEPAPAAGQTVEFYATSSARTPDALLCSAVTDDAGVASCTPENPMILDVLSGKGFVAKFAGSDAYRAAVATAPLAQINTTSVPASS